MTREWENKKTQQTYATQGVQRAALKKKSNLKPAYLVRYADDWILATESEEKTVITNLRETPIHFLGCACKVVKGKSRTGQNSIKEQNKGTSPENEYPQTLQE